MKSLPRGEATGSKPKGNLDLVMRPVCWGNGTSTACWREPSESGPGLGSWGDVRQLSAVSAGKPFEVMQTAGGMQTAKMTEIHRQKNDLLKDTVADIIEKRERTLSRSWPGILSRAERQREIDSRIVADVHGMSVGEIRHELSGAGEKSHKDTLVITALNEDRRAINNGVRQALKEDGVISGQARDTEVLVNRGMTKAQASHAQNYHEDV